MNEKMQKLIDKQGFIYEKDEDLYKSELPSGRKSPLYNKWYKMIDRCYNEKYHSYHRYGGRGITVCDEWRNSFRAFVDWAINHPTFEPGLEIDRRNNNGNYCLENNRFVTQKENKKKYRSY